MTPVVERSDVERFRAILAARFGFRYEDGKLDFLADVLRQRMAAMGCSRVDSYLEHLAAPLPGRDELRALAEKLTVGETFFFRNGDHFRAFADVVLPERIRARMNERRLRILSAGCATGEEPYSIATLVREALPDLEAWHVEILGIDINASALARAARAHYSGWSLRTTSDAAKRRYFRAEGRHFVLDRAIQEMVTFEERNLVEDDPAFWQPRRFDVVFCRNVIMYFAPDVAREIVLRIGQALAPGGFLFLGHAETLRGLSEEFHLRHTHGTFYYERRRAPDAAVSYGDSPGQAAAVARTLPPPAAEHTGSWVDVIQRASDRIASLASGRSRSADAAIAGGSAMPPTARSWDLGLVHEAVRQERFSDALELLHALPPDAEREPDTLLVRAVLLTNSGKLEEAESVCRRLLVADELNAGAHYVMALCRENAGDAEAAIEHDETAAYLDAAFAMPHVHRGLVARRAGDVATARRALARALLLLAREEEARVLLFGGGFTREALVQLCRTELRTLGGEQ